MQQVFVLCSAGLQDGDDGGCAKREICFFDDVMLWGMLVKIMHGAMVLKEMSLCVGATRLYESETFATASSDV